MNDATTDPAPTNHRRTDQTSSGVDKVVAAEDPSALLDYLGQPFEITIAS